MIRPAVPLGSRRRFERIQEFIREALEAFAPSPLGKGGRRLRSQLEILCDEARVQRQFRQSVEIVKGHGVEDFEQRFAMLVFKGRAGEDKRFRLNDFAAPFIG